MQRNWVRNIIRIPGKTSPGKQSSLVPKEVKRGGHILDNSYDAILDINSTYGYSIASSYMLEISSRYQNLERMLLKWEEQWDENGDRGKNGRRKFNQRTHIPLLLYNESLFLYGEQLVFCPLFGVNKRVRKLFPAEGLKSEGPYLKIVEVNCFPSPRLWFLCGQRRELKVWMCELVRLPC